MFQLTLGHGAKVLALECDAATSEATITRQQTDNGVAHNTLAASAFADDAEGLATLERETDVMHDVGKAEVGPETDAQPLDGSVAAIA